MHLGAATGNATVTVLSSLSEGSSSVPSGLECAGLVLNYVDDERDSASISNRAVLEQVLDVPVLADVLHGAEEIEIYG